MKKVKRHADAHQRRPTQWAFRDLNSNQTFFFSIMKIYCSKEFSLTTEQTTRCKAVFLGAQSK